MGKWTDKLYITHTEMSGVHGQHLASSSGAQSRSSVQFARLPYDHCALALVPFSIPVMTRQGNIYDVGNIVPWLKEHGTDPVTGRKMGTGELISLRFEENADGQKVDPMTRKVFTEHSQVVAVVINEGKEANAYSKDTVDRLNIKPNNYLDLLTSSPFERSDIITIQDPTSSTLRALDNFDHVKKGIKFNKPEEGDVGNINAKALGNGAKEKLIRAGGGEKDNGKGKGKAEDAEETAPGDVDGAKKGEETTKAASPTKSAAPSRYQTTTSSLSSASFTSTSIPVSAATQRELMDEEELMFDLFREGAAGIKGKNRAYVTLETTEGGLNLELFCDKAPKTCYNFLMLARNGKYDKCPFHRLIKGFMLQGGDPTGTGTGGASWWGTNFRDEYALKGALKHDARGTLSMANHGKDTNSSQFFLTFRDTPHLNNKHTVFGRLVGGESVLDKIEAITTDARDRPTRPLAINSVTIFRDPFDEYKRARERRYGKEAVKRKEDRDKDRVTWFGGQLDVANTAGDGEGKELEGLLSKGKKGETSGVGKYVERPQAALGNGVGRAVAAVAGSSKRKAGEDSEAEVEQVMPSAKAKKKVKAQGGFGDFSAW